MYDQCLLVVRTQQWYRTAIAALSLVHSMPTSVHMLGHSKTDEEALSVMKVNDRTNKSNKHNNIDYWLIQKHNNSNTDNINTNNGEIVLRKQ